MKIKFKEGGVMHPMKRRFLVKLVQDLWWFIENRRPGEPDTEVEFFRLRSRVRELIETEKM